MFRSYPPPDCQLSDGLLDGLEDVRNRRDGPLGPDDQVHVLGRVAALDSSSGSPASGEIPRRTDMRSVIGTVDLQLPARFKGGRTREASSVRLHMACRS